MRITQASGDDLVKVIEGASGTPVQGRGVEHEITVSDLMRQVGDNPAEIEFATRVTGDSFDRLQILADGTIKQGSGAAAPYASPLADSVLQPMVRAGNLYFRIPVVGLVSAALQTTNGTYVPLMVPRACTLTEIGVETTVAGSTGSAMRLGLYADSVATPGIPDGLIADFGQTDTSGAAGNKMVTGLTQALQPYVLYWLFAGSQLNVTTTIAAASNNQVLPQATINVASTTGFPASGTIYIGASNVPIAYTGTTATTFTGCSGGTATLATGQTVLGVPTTHPTIRIAQAHSTFGHIALVTYTGTGPQTNSNSVMGALPSVANVGNGPTGSAALFWVRLSA